VGRETKTSGHKKKKAVRKGADVWGLKRAVSPQEEGVACACLEGQTTSRGGEGKHAAARSKGRAGKTSDNIESASDAKRVQNSSVTQMGGWAGERENDSRKKRGNPEEKARRKGNQET